MVSWAIRDRRDCVLDPSCGDGVFLVAATERLLVLGAKRRSISQQVAGMDLNLEAVSVTRTALKEAVGFRSSHLATANFFAARPTDEAGSPWAAVDAVVGNPPYIRYQDFNGGMRAQALVSAAQAGVRLTQLTSSWAPFVVHAISFLRPGGRLALILPAELAHAQYAEPLREHLLRCFREVNVISFRQAVFPNAQVEVVVLLADGRDSSSKRRLRLVEADNDGDLVELEHLLARSVVFDSGHQPSKWLPGFGENAGVRCLDELKEKGLVVPLSETGKANIGFVSGANDLFVLSPADASMWRLPKASLRPCVIRARQIPGALITQRDFSALRVADDRCLLWLPRRRLTRSELAYVRHGKRLRIQQRYKCRTRVPWYTVPGVMVPEAFLTYMSDEVPRLCLNEARLAAANTLLTVRIESVPRHLQRAFVGAFYNSATLLSCERNGRSYGGGVLKLEPREADRMLLPALEVVERHKDDLSGLVTVLDRELRKGRSGRIRETISAVDDLVLQRGLGLSADDVRNIQEARKRLVERRLQRAKSMRSHRPTNPPSVVSTIG